MKNWFQDITYCEFPQTTDRDLLDRLFFFNIILLVFLLTAIPFSIFHAARGAYLIAFFQLVGSAFLVAIREYIRTTRRYRRGFIATVFFVLPIFLINYITGGVSNCGPLWYYCYPMGALLLVGPRLGSVAAISLMLVSLLLLVEPFESIMRTTYPPEFIMRFFISYTIVYFLAFAYEFQKYRTGKKIKKLSGLLPICANCKKIRDDQGYWNQIETYLAEHAKAEFSHSICPDCMREKYPELEIKN